MPHSSLAVADIIQSCTPRGDRLYSFHRQLWYWGVLARPGSPLGEQAVAITSWSLFTALEEGACPVSLDDNYNSSPAVPLYVYCVRSAQGHEGYHTIWGPS